MVIKKAHKQKIRKVHFVALMDIRHIQKYKYIPERDEAGIRADFFGVQSWTKC